MRRDLVFRFLVIWLVFGLGASLGFWIASSHAAECKTQIVEFDNDGLTNAALAALPAASTGSGTVTFALDMTGIRVHADSALANQSYDVKVPALVHGSPITIELPASLLRRLLVH